MANRKDGQGAVSPFTTLRIRSSPHNKPKPASHSIVSSKPHSTPSSTSQVLPTSPTKKIKLSHPSSSPATSPPKSSVKTTMKAKTKSKQKSNSLPKPAPKSSYKTMLSIILKVALCYILLGYFYFCPLDPSQNPRLCSTLAELHWAIEPHLKPHFQTLNAHVFEPVDRMIVKPLRDPVLDKVILPFQKKFESARIQERYINPLAARLRAQLTPLFIKLRYQLTLLSTRARTRLGPLTRKLCTRLKPLGAKLRARLIIPLMSHLRDLLTTLFDRAAHHYTTSLKSHLPASLLLRSRRHALRTKVSTLRRSLFYRTYISPIQKHCKAAKIWFKLNVVVKVRRLAEKFVRPLVVRIFEKSDQLHRVRDAGIPGKIKAVQEKWAANGGEKEKVVQEEKFQAKTGGGEAEADAVIQPLELAKEAEAEVVDMAPQEEVPQMPRQEDMELEAEYDPEEVEQDRPSAQGEAEAAKVQDVLQPVPADEQPVSSPEEEGLVAQVGFEVEEEAPSLIVSQDATQEKSPPKEREAADAQEVLAAEEVEKNAHAKVEEETSGSSEEGLIGDFDDLINEAKPEEEASVADQPEDQPSKQTKRPSVEETAQDRAELEEYAQEGLKQMAALESSELERLIERLNAKRDPSNVILLQQIISRSKLDRIKSESVKLLEKLGKWFQKQTIVESKSTSEKLDDINLVVRKSKEKVKAKLVEVVLAEVEDFGREQLMAEMQILDQSWFAVDNYATEVQFKLGPGFTWLDDVTYMDWKLYHSFRTIADECKARYEKLVLGTDAPDLLARLHYPTFFPDLDAFRNEILSKHAEFEQELEKLKDTYIEKLLAKTEDRSVEGMKSMSNEEAAGAASHLASSVSNSHAQRARATGSSESTDVPVDDQAKKGQREIETLREPAKKITLNGHGDGDAGEGREEL